MRCAAVGGGPVSLQNVLEAIEGGFPMVVVKGTGRVADLICAIREQQSIRYVRNQCIGACASNNAHVLPFDACLQSARCRIRARQEMQRVRIYLAALADMFAHP
jgi:hypothetical protein